MDESPKYDFDILTTTIPVIEDMIHAGCAVIVYAGCLAPDMKTMAAAYLAMYYASPRPTDLEGY